MASQTSLHHIKLKRGAFADTGEVFFSSKEGTKSFVLRFSPCSSTYKEQQALLCPEGVHPVTKLIHSPGFPNPKSKELINKHANNLHDEDSAAPFVFRVGAGDATHSETPIS